MLEINFSPTENFMNHFKWQGIASWWGGGEKAGLQPLSQPLPDLVEKCK